MDTLKRSELIGLCKKEGLRAYSNKTKAQLIELLATNNKKCKGQFYTTRIDYILDDMPQIPVKVSKLIEPFAGQGDIVKWVSKHYPHLKVALYDIDPKYAGTTQRDTLTHPPDYSNA